MKYIKCGSEIYEGQKFCSNCGHPIEGHEMIFDSLDGEYAYQP